MWPTILNNLDSPNFFPTKILLKSENYGGLIIEIITNLLDKIRVKYNWFGGYMSPLTLNTIPFRNYITSSTFNA